MENGRREPEQESRGTNWGAWLLFGAPILVVLMCLAGALSGGGEQREKDAQRFDAERVCEEEFIADRLKAPSTADYDLTARGGPVTYTVTGTVDSENSFGAKLRSEVTCVVRLDGDRWILESLTGLG